MHFKQIDKEALNHHDCEWFTFKDGEVVPEELVELVRKQGGELVDDSEKPKEKPKVNLDINGDGKVDDKDAKLAGKVLRNARKRKKGKK